MKINAKQRLATGTALVAIALIGVAIGWASTQVEDANRLRRHAGEIVRGLTDLRMVTFEYSVNRLERARAQWHAVSDRVDRLIASSDFGGAAEREIVGSLRAKRAVVRQLFGELEATFAAGPADAPDDEANRLLRAQLLSRLLIGQQDKFSDAYRLTELAAERIDTAQRRVLTVIVVGLTLIAAITLGAGWLLNHAVLGPITRLQHTALQVTAGDGGYPFEGRGDDEIGQLTQSLYSMTRSLQQSYAQVERSNRELAVLNEELKAFSYSVSHDLRAPLRTMDGFALALLQDYGDRLDAEGKDFLLRIRAASQRMARLIDDLLALSRVTRVELTLQSVDLTAMAREIAEELRQAHPERSVTWLIDDNVTLQADKALMGMVMRNLLDNAWKFTARTDGATIRVGSRPHEGTTAYCVADNGAGFDMAYADRLFSPFARLHNVTDYSGTGIGLAIVQRIVRRHDGRTWAQAKVGAGATFFFTVGDLGNEAHGQAHAAG